MTTARLSLTALRGFCAVERQSVTMLPPRDIWNTPQIFQEWFNPTSHVPNKLWPLTFQGACVLEILFKAKFTRQHCHQKRKGLSTHADTYTCPPISIFVGTFIDITHNPAHHPNLNHPNLNPILTSTLKPGLKPQIVLWSCGDQPKRPHVRIMSSLC